MQEKTAQKRISKLTTPKKTLSKNILTKNVLDKLAEENIKLRRNMAVVKDTVVAHDLQNLMQYRFMLFQSKIDKLRLKEKLNCMPLMFKMGLEIVRRYEKNIKFEKTNMFASNLNNLVKTRVFANDITTFHSHNLLKKEKLSLDSVLYYRMLDNLIKNAYEGVSHKFDVGYGDESLKHIQKNGRINVDLNLVKNDLVLIVSDNGIGLTPEKLDQMRKNIRFTTKTEDTNLHGLGMRSVRDCIEQHGGKFSIQSVRGINGATIVSGTNIVVSIPVK
jgi:signal transduction histidine kinase